MSSHTIASSSTCMHGLRRLQLCAWPLRRCMAGRCLQSLHSAVSDRPAPRRQPASCQAAPSHSAPASFTASAGLSARSGLLPLLACPLSTALQPSGQRQLHASTVCAAKKQSADGLVKRISKGRWLFSNPSCV